MESERASRSSSQFFLEFSDRIPYTEKGEDMLPYLRPKISGFVYSQVAKLSLGSFLDIIQKKAERTANGGPISHRPKGGRSGNAVGVMMM